MSSSTQFRDLTVERLRQAADLYLEVAYPSGEVPPPVRRRLDWPADLALADLLARPPFETVHPRDGEGATVFALRLGNARYPHMKLQVQPWPTSVGYMLSVNTHDQVLSLDPDAPDAPAFRELQAANQHMKEAIEQAWDRAGLPTFLRYLRDYLDNHPAPAEPDRDPA